jgi:FkbM family methyltransferase
MRIAILYICTGRYTIFWDDFFISCEKYFLPGHEKRYFVFTDGCIAHESHERVMRIEQPRLGWPHDTLKRFHMFSRVAGDLAAFDFVFFFNANCEFRQTVNDAVLPTEEEGLVVVRHPGFFDKIPDDFTYDRNPASRAYIPFGRGRYYVCGGVNGGRSSAYCQLIHDLREAVDEDERNGVMAVWHDESHLNKYILTKNHTLLSPAYCHPENWKIPFPEIIRVRDKFIRGGPEFLRCQNRAKVSLGARGAKLCRVIAKKLGFAFSRDGVLVKTPIDRSLEKLASFSVHALRGKTTNFETLKKIGALCAMARGIGTGGNVHDSGEVVVLQRLRSVLPDRVVLFDVGANVGGYAEELLAVFGGEHCSIHCFEPSAETMRLLRANPALRDNPAIYMNNTALGREAGAAVLYSDADASGLASLTKRRLDHCNIVFDRQEACQVDTLAGYCDQQKIEKIDLLKIDVGGHELAVLQGAGPLFKREAVSFIQFEFGGCDIDTRTFLQDFFYFLLPLDFSLFRITPSGYCQFLPRYTGTDEQFLTTNFLAVHRKVFLNFQACNS